MKLSKKAYYGLRATLALVAAEKPLSIHILAKNEGIPEGYLEKILQALRKKGLLTSARGVTGGYTLTQKNINAWEVIEALDGPLKVYPAFNSSSKNSGRAPKDIKDVLPCYQTTHCQANHIFRKVEESLEETLKDISLASLVQNSPR